jgi:exopolysaccharide biosynthesis polyprenyl glycosylphosphotransferase
MSAPSGFGGTAGDVAVKVGADRADEGSRRLVAKESGTWSKEQQLASTVQAAEVAQEQEEIGRACLAHSGRDAWCCAEESACHDCAPPLRVVMDSAHAHSLEDALDACTRTVLTPSSEIGAARTRTGVSVCHRAAPEGMRAAVRRADGAATLAVMPESFGLVYPHLPKLGLDEVPVFDPHDGPRRRFALALKRAADVVLAIVFLVLLLPLLAVVAALIKRDSPGPVLFTQDRIGRRGRTFTIFKFRTMVQDAHVQERHVASACAADPRFIKIDCDPRVTRLGGILRKTSIDELPQLWNVIRGDMSFVGPRPSQPSEVAHYEREHFARLLVRPGITGMWQVSGRSDLDFEQAVALDTAYVTRWHPLLDLRILAKTVLVVLNCRGAC